MIREYSGWLQFEEREGLQARIEACAARRGLVVDATSSALEFEFQGRDTTRFVVGFLRDLAALLGDADGEVECAIDDGSGETRFEFFLVREGRLWTQTGVIVRGPLRPVVGS